MRRAAVGARADGLVRPGTATATPLGVRAPVTVATAGSPATASRCSGRTPACAEHLAHVALLGRRGQQRRRHRSRRPGPCDRSGAGSPCGRPAGRRAARATRRRRGCRARRRRWRRAPAPNRRGTRRGRGCAAPGCARRAARRRAMPARPRLLASRSAPCLVRTKQSVRPSRAAIVATRSNLASNGTRNTWWLIVSTDASTRAQRVHRRVGEVVLDERGDVTVERGGEQQPLAAGRRLVEQPAHHRQEAEVGHVVGLVEHGDLDRVEVAGAALDQVDEPAGGGDEDVDARSAATGSAC